VVNPVAIIMHLGQPQSGIRTLVVYRDFWDAESDLFCRGAMLLLTIIGTNCTETYTLQLSQTAICFRPYKMLCIW